METDPIGVCELLVGLPEVNVLGVDDVAGELIRIHVESRVGRPGVSAVRDAGVGQGPARGRVGGSGGVRASGAPGVA